MIVSPIIDLEVDYVEKRNGRVHEKGKIPLTRGEDIEIVRILRDSYGTLDAVIEDGDDEIEILRVPKHYLT